MTRAQGKHREFSLNQSVATLFKCTANIIVDYNIIGGLQFT